MPQLSAALAAAVDAPPSAKPTPSLGLAFLGRLVFEGDRLQQVWSELIARLTADARDAGALLDLSTLLQMRGEREKGLTLQAAALALGRCYRTVHGSGRALRVLAFVAPGDLMTNTPLDFLLEGSDVELTTWYVDGAAPRPDEVPDHDLAFLAISQADDGSAALAPLVGAFEAWPKPVINGRADLIAALSRDGVANAFAGHPRIVAPATRQVARTTLDAVCANARFLATLHPDLTFPIIVRPIGSHAGKGLEKLYGTVDLADYLERHEAAEFFIAAFCYYAGADGLYRKLRVVFVNGRPFVAHMAVSARWMVHYLNADMGEVSHRQEEARMMATFDDAFAARHAEAFADLTRAFGLDYVGIDCAETQDGRLVVFEADVAMIVHAMDSAELYPYKKPAMAKLFAGFVAGLQAAVGRRRLAA
ncbi:RimK family alpha-L-glutamate ligase [Phenylobacterium sp.]|uniref:ATP-grasp domain-containing protein n=1 Tax=Phenylobacterium sp. TaxID=1871053 RepID=UPI00374CA1BB